MNKLIQILRKANWKRILLVVSMLPVIVAIFYFSFRNVLLHRIIDSKASYYKEKRQVAMSFGDIHFSGISGIEASAFSITPLHSDTLISINKLYFHIRVLPLLFGNVRVDELEIDRMKLRLLKLDTLNNYSFLIQRKKSSDTATVESSHINFAETADKLLDNIFDNIPGKISMTHSNIHATIDSSDVFWKINQLELSDGKLISNAIITENNNSVHWNVNADIDKADRTIDFTLAHQPNSKASLPFLSSIFKLKCSFDTLHASISNTDFDDNRFYISGDAYISNTIVNQWRISPNDVLIKKASLNYRIFFDENGLGIDSTTSCAINNIHLNPYVAYQLYPVKTFALNISMPNCDGNSFFNSLPKGLFSSLEGIQTKGSLAYQLRFYIDTSNPDSLQFNSTIIPQQLKIVNDGMSNLYKMNGEFLYTAFEKDIPVATFPVGSSNPDFTALENISPYLKNAVLVSEDGDFYWHKGFNERAFRKSIATNFKEKKFKRGGSTISMQLVKNVFLTRKKTIARKLEEAMIVWLIENNRITSKDRMMEVYLNVIEWGPGVYGATEASRFYFNKRPSDLSIAESIYLAMIIPRPKYFYWHFDETGHLKKQTESYFKHVANHLCRRQIISEEEKLFVNNDIILIGVAKDALKIKVDSMPIDSLQLIDDIIEN